MTYLQATRFFGGLIALAAILDLPKTTVHSWKRRPGGIPWARQYDIEQASGGALTAAKREPAKRNGK